LQPAFEKPRVTSGGDGAVSFGHGCAGKLRFLDDGGGGMGKLRELRWECPRPGEAKAISREDPIVVYKIAEVPDSAKFKVQIRTEAGSFALRPESARRRSRFPDGFHSMRAAQKACQKHFNQWQRKIALQKADASQAIDRV
jgi:hypothetical protein